MRPARARGNMTRDQGRGKGRRRRRPGPLHSESQSDGLAPSTFFFFSVVPPRADRQRGPFPLPPLVRRASSS